MTVPFIRHIFCVRIHINLFHPLINPASETRVKIIDVEFKNTAKAVGIFLDLTVLINQFNQLFKAISLCDVIHNQVGLKIGKTEVCIIAGPRKALFNSPTGKSFCS